MDSKTQYIVIINTETKGTINRITLEQNYTYETALDRALKRATEMVENWQRTLFRETRLIIIEMRNARF